MTVPSDRPARDAIVECLDENMVVEAGAGTGKTTSLVGRIVALITTGRASMGGIAAITFTEAAASELRERITEELERAAVDPERVREERRRCESAVHDLDQAAIQTLHSFAGSLLRERPLEAGLPPGFDIRDEIEADIAFDRRWSEWLDETLDDPEAQEALRPALAEGLSLRHMREIADKFRVNYDLLQGEPFDMPSEHSPKGEREAELVPVIELLRRFVLDYADERKKPKDKRSSRTCWCSRAICSGTASTPATTSETATPTSSSTRCRTPIRSKPNSPCSLPRTCPTARTQTTVRGTGATCRPPTGSSSLWETPSSRSIVSDGRTSCRSSSCRNASAGRASTSNKTSGRSAPVIDWVNHVFAQWMEESDGQPEYIPLDAEPGDGAPPPVRYIGGEIGGVIGDVRRQEANAIAHAIANGGARTAGGCRDGSASFDPPRTATSAS